MYAWAQTEILPQFSTTRQGTFPYILGWEYGNAYTWCIGGPSSLGAWHHDFDYGPDAYFSMVLYSTGRGLPEDVVFVHRLKERFYEYSEKKGFIISMVEFVEKFGANTNPLMVKVVAMGDRWEEARGLYIGQDYEVSWFEEPLNPDAIDDYVLLRRHAPVPISGGEVLTRRQSFDAWLRKGAFDIVQPDVTKVGGISESRRIAWMAQENGIRYIPHGWNTAVGLAADLQLASAFSDTDLVEYITGSPYIDEIAAGGWQIDEDGLLHIPEAPGLGLTLDRDAVARYTDGDLHL